MNENSAAPAAAREARGPSRLCGSALVAALALGATGCEQLLRWSQGDGPPRGSVARMQRELAMNLQWQNRSFSELKAALGQPVLVMHIPGGGNPPGFAAVYGVDPVSGCIDAFALLYGNDPIVRVYYCR